MGKVALLVTAVVLSAGTAFAAELPPVLTASKTTVAITAVDTGKSEVCIEPPRGRVCTFTKPNPLVRWL